MGWSFGRSIRIGPFRLNFSKSGVGASVGAGGARVGIGPRGTRFNFSLLGLRYQKKISDAKMPKWDALLKKGKETTIRPKAGARIAGAEMTLRVIESTTFGELRAAVEKVRTDWEDDYPLGTELEFDRHFDYGRERPIWWTMRNGSGFTLYAQPDGGFTLERTHK